GAFSARSAGADPAGDDQRRKSGLAKRLALPASRENHHHLPPAPPRRALSQRRNPRVRPPRKRAPRVCHCVRFVSCVSRKDAKGAKDAKKILSFSLRSLLPLRLCVKYYRSNFIIGSWMSPLVPRNCSL